MVQKSPLVVVAANSAWNILNYRLGLVKALEAAGYRVVISAPPGDDSDRLRTEGFAVEAVPMQPRGTSPLADALLAVRYWRLMRRLRPAAFLGFTIKPNIYGSLAAAAAGACVINNISGLGTLFVRRSAVTGLAIRLYRAALQRSAMVFFQNRDDADLFLAERLVRRDQAECLPGSGVDLDRFTPQPEPAGPTTFLLAARLLWDKGIAEYVDAARSVRKIDPSVRFQILGFVEPGAAAVPETLLAEWERQGVVDYLGAEADIRPCLAAASCVVLPSYYREGVPRILLEAAAMARPVITTDSPGCRDAVDDGITGFLCAPRSADSLAASMKRFLALSRDEREAMGRAGRAKMERAFSQEIVHRAYLDALRRCGVVPGGVRNMGDVAA